MTQRQKYLFDQVKLWAFGGSFPTLLAIVVFFLIRYMNQQDKIMDKLDSMMVNIEILKVKYEQHDKDIIKLDTKTTSLERDNTDVRR